MSDKQSIRQKFRSNIIADGNMGVQGGEYPIHGEAQVRVQTSGFGGTNEVTIQVKIWDGEWFTLDTVTGNADSGALDVSTWDFVRFNVTVADGTGSIKASGFFSKAQSAGSGASAAFTVIQPDSGTSPTATGSTDTLTLIGTEGVTTVGDATTDTLTFKLNINALTEDLTPVGATDYIVTYDTSAGSHKKVLLDNIPGLGGGGGGSGDIVGPSSSTDNEMPRFDGTTGKLLQGSGIIVSDTRQIWAPNATYSDSMAIGISNVLNGARSYIFGNVCAVAQWSVAIGYSCSATNQRAVAIGYICKADGGSGAVALGFNASSSGAAAITLGSNPSASTTGSVAIGSNTVASTQNFTFAMGQAATATGSFAIALGPSTDATGASSVAIGNQAQATANFAFSIFGNALHASSCVIGFTSSTAANQLVLGGYSSGAGGFKDVYIGYGVTSTVTNHLTINGTGASGTNIAGKNLSIYAGKGTGTGEGGSVYIGTSLAGSSGSALNPTTNFLQVSTNGVIINPSFNSAGDFRIEGILGYTMSFWDASTGYITHYMDNVIHQDTNSVKMLELETGKRVYIGANNLAPTDGNLFNGSICPYLDESGNNLIFRVKYSDGTLKTASIALT